MLRKRNNIAPARPQKRSAQTGPATRLQSDSSGPGVIPSGFDRELLPFLDLVGMLIADRILAEATAVAGEKVQASCRAEDLIDAASTVPGIAGPTPKIPADSHIQSHSSSIPSRQQKRTGLPTIKESPHASK